MKAHRRTMIALFSLCAIVLVLSVAGASAQAPEEHTYLPAHSMIDEIKPEATACGVATDSAGDVYVASDLAKKILIYSPSATKITEFTPALNEPCSLAVDSAGAVYVQEFNGKVVKEKPSSFPPTAATTYAPEESAGSKGVIVPKTGHARAIAVDPANQRLYVAFAGHVSSYESNGTLISATIGEGLVSGSNYRGLDVYGANGDVYVTDTAHHRAYVLNPAGTEILTEITGAGSPVSGGEFTGERIDNLAVDQSDGNVYVYYAGENQIKATSTVYEFNASGVYLSKIGHEFDGGLLALREFEGADLAVDNGSSSPNQGDVYVSGEDQPNEADSVYAFGPALPKFPLNLSASGTGSGSFKCKVNGGPTEACAAVYIEGSEVEVLALPNPGSKLLEWSGACSGSGACKVTMSEAHSVGAAFELLSGKTLTVTKSGTGTGSVASDVAGVQGEKIECGTRCFENFTEGELVKLSGTPGPNTEAALWSGCEAVNGADECEVTMSAAKAVVVTFKLNNRELTISKSGPGSLTVQCENAPSNFSSCAKPLGELLVGTHVRVTASPAAGAELESFAGTGSAAGCEAQGSPCTFTITENSSVSAEFALIPRTLAIQATGKGAGQVNCQVNGGATDAPCAPSYPDGTLLKLTSIATGGSEFTGFNGGSGSASACTGTAPCEFTIKADSSLKAAFILTGEKTLAIDTSTGTGSGQVNCLVNGGATDAPCAASYPPGTLLKLTPASGPHSQFSGFSAGTGSAGACTGTAPCEFTLAANSSLAAPFAAILHTLAITIAGEGEVECKVNGAAAAEPCAAEYKEGTELELIARPKTQWAFEAWGEGTGSIACTGAGTCGPFELEADSSVTASFATVATGPFGLPDGRGWEMVSPPEKHGALVEPIGEDWLIQAAADGNALAYVTRTASEAAPAGALIYDSALADRSASGGWSSRELALPHAFETGLSVGEGWEYRFFNADLSRAFVQPFGPFLPCESETGEAQPCLSPNASEQTAFLASDYAPGTKQPCSTSCYTPLVTGAPGFANVPPGTEFGQTSIFAGNCPPKLYCGPTFLDATPDTNHALLESHEALTESPAAGHPIPANSLYEWSAEKPPAEQLRLISVLPGNSAGEALPAEGGTYIGSNDGGQVSARHAISPDGSRVVFADGIFAAHRDIYLRENATEAQSALNGSGECTEAQKACTIRLDEGLSGTPTFQDADAGLTRIFFTDRSEQGSNDLYEYDVATETLTRLTEGAHALGVAIGASEDGNSIYFVGAGAIAPGAVLGANLYLLHDGAGGWEAPRLIAVLAANDEADWGGDQGTFPALTARVSPNGRYAAFMSQRDPTGYDNRDAVSGEPDQEVYEYDAATEALACASCNPSGARPRGVNTEQTRGWVAANVPGWTNNKLTGAIYQSRYLSNSGRLFFNSSDALAPKDSNGTVDVYQYEPEGVGNCTSSSGSGSVAFEPASKGCVGLISSGLSGRESAFLDASESGDDVFFLTASRLSGKDEDTALDVYDARVGGGETQPIKPVECAGDACQQPAVPPNDPTPGSLTFSGAGNVTECPKGMTLKQGKCAKQKSKNKHHKKHKKNKKNKKNKRANDNRGGAK
jgi:hypothetical protein